MQGSHRGHGQVEAMINNVKVKPLKRMDTSADTENCFKASFSTITSENLLITIILPFKVPDNVCNNASREAKECLQ